MKETAILAAFYLTGGISTPGFAGSPQSVEYYPDVFTNKVYEESIHTVLLSSDTWELSSPVIESGSSQRLELHFDDLSGSMRTMGYTFVHCDANWHPSDLPAQTYLSGFGHGLIREALTSFNTTRDYIHYRLLIPEEDCMPVLSGNYALVVYDETNPDELILTRRFYVTEKSVQIEAKLKQPPPGAYRETGQQLEFTVQFDNSVFRDPLNDILVLIRQNNRDDNALTFQRPAFSRTGRLEYFGLAEGIFAGGNEFRNLDIKSMKYQTEKIAAIEFRNPYYHVFLKTDATRGNKPYFSGADLNGRYFIDREKSDDKHTEADYVYVHFSFAPPAGYAGESIFVTGGLCDWTLHHGNKMTHNPASERLEVTLLLKQGWYDYGYAMEDPVTGTVNGSLLEGSFYETGNEYGLFIYYHDRFGRYDRLIGYLPLKKG